MKAKIVMGSVLAVVLMAVLPAVQAVEYDTARETQQAWAEEQVASLDVRELLARLQSGEKGEDFEQLMAENGLANCILAPLKWLAHILLNVLMIPLKLAIKIMVQLLVIPIKLLSLPFRLMLLPLRLMLLPLRVAMTPLIVLLKVVTFPFRMLDLMLFLLCPFKHTREW
ncbi:MAG TPA: hypothetical protein ENN54_01020 [Thermoplasmatales archaeon]|nr:hypothetical protein [Thermoplasmatales archaeon]